MSTQVRLVLYVARCSGTLFKAQKKGQPESKYRIAQKLSTRRWLKFQSSYHYLVSKRGFKYPLNATSVHVCLIGGGFY